MRHPPPHPHHGRWLVVLLAGLVLAVGAAGCGGGGAADGGGESPPGSSGQADRAGSTRAFEGGIVSPRRTAPPLALSDSTGHPFDLRELRGAPVLVTFVYARCPDVCPAIMQRLKQVRAASGDRGRDLRVVAVSVDPEGDTPEIVSDFLGRQRLNGFVRYLIGDRPVLERVWADWAVATTVPTDNPELIEHTALIYGITSSGELATAYPIEFDPAAIARDMELLAES
jgi:protein SCO1/2